MSDDQLDLLTPRRMTPDVSNATVGSPTARRDDPQTAKDAAVMAGNTSETQRALILGALSVLGPHGANYFEMDLALWPDLSGDQDRHASGCWRRMSELAHPKAGAPLIEWNGLTRQTSGPSYHGRVYVLPEYRGRDCLCPKCVQARMETAARRSRKAKRSAAAAQQ